MHARVRLALVDGLLAVLALESGRALARVRHTFQLGVATSAVRARLVCA